MKNAIYIFLFMGFICTSCKTDKKENLNKLNKVLSETEPTLLESVPYTVEVKNPVATSDYPTLQSFTFGQADGKWLMVGGRTNGFHRTSTPESTFPTKTANSKVWVLDHSTKEVKSVPLPAKVEQHLRSTNMLFYQDGDWLYCVGGYGSNCDNDAPECYQTWPKLAALNVPAIIEKIWNSTGEPDISADILTIDDERMRITGGGMKKIGDSFYAVFGQNYNSIYIGGVTGIYTEEVRKFKISNDGSSIQITDYEAYKDPSGATGVESQYHRRDLGVVSAIRPDGSKGISVYGGVFTKDDGGWMNPIYINETKTGTKVEIDSSFQQEFNQYECGHVLMYDPVGKNMFTTFLGGISFYYFNSEGEKTASSTNNWLPFVKVINSIARRSDGSSMEFPQAPPSQMPDYLGANAVFVPAKGVETYGGTAEIIDFSKLAAGETMVGYMYGGIQATTPQASQINPTIASAKVYEVYVTKL
ncbi:MAG: hypothetical protein P1U56_15720 [Saprospiraceae bacterium]|nr:hypothetical protein [Saprospiraceae bacterium]